jgi:CHASE3 domain sensor protein
MRNRIRTIAALLIVAALAAALFAARSYQRERDYYRVVYTRLIDSQDVVDAARNSLGALEEVVIHGQNYVLTGETRYSKAYAADISSWQDEIGTLALLAEHDQALPLVKDLRSTGDRAVRELGAVIALYDGGSRDKALENLRKESGVVALDHARDTTGTILTVTRREVSTNGGMITNGFARRRVAVSVAVLFCLTLIGAVLLIFETRRAAKLRSTNPAGNLPDRA